MAGFSADMEDLIEAHDRYHEALAACRARAPGWFRSVREGLGLTQAALADRMEVTDVWISRVETGTEPAGYRGLLRMFEFVRDHVDEKMKQAGMGATP